MKRVLLILLCILLTLCSCEATVDLGDENVIGAYAPKEENKQEKPLTSLTMLYYPDMDTNPVTTTCLANHELLKLVYSPLIYVSDRFDPVCVLADSYTIDGSKVTVKLKSGIVFSNGEAVGANDVVKTFNAVKKSGASPYRASLNKIKKYYALDSTTVVCEFYNADADCVNLLDIPIMQGGKAGVGCGAYVMSEQNGKPALIPNEKYFEKASVSVIHLTETKSDDYIDDMFSSGALDVMIPNTTDDLKLTSLRDYRIEACPSNRLVFVGINFRNPTFSTYEVRKAISDVIDRKTIASQSLVDLATPTEYPFNPEWSKMSAYKLKGATDDEILFARARLKGLSLTLTVPTGGYKQTIATELVECFKAAGLTLNLRELDAQTYTQAIAAGDFELYLGETAISRNMDPTELYKTNGALNFSGYNDFDLDTLFYRYKSGEVTLAEYLDAFDSRLPIIPVLYAKSVLYCANGINAFSGRSAFSAYGNGAGLTLKK